MNSPEMSVVVVVFAGRDYPARTLRALAEQVGAPSLEVLLCHDDGLVDPEGITKSFPEMRLVAMPGRNRTFAELRAAGVHAARGRLIAITEDQIRPTPSWCAEIHAAHESDCVAAGGAVEKGPTVSGKPDTTLNWAIYLCDFVRYANPVPEGNSEYLTDTNVSYKKAALDGIPEVWAEEFHETDVNWTLAGKGGELYLSPRIVVEQQRDLTLGEALHERYSFGRLFASTRVRATGLGRRLYYAAFSIPLALPLTYRVFKHAWPRPRYRGPFLRGLFHVALLNGVWCLGEFVGYTTGRAGGLAPEDDEAIHGSGASSAGAGSA